MGNEREYDTYCAYKNTMVVRSEYNQSGCFDHFSQNGIHSAVSSKTPCKCIGCENTDRSVCDTCDWPKELEKEFKEQLAKGSCTHRCIACMAQYKQHGYLR